MFALPPSAEMVPLDEDDAAARRAARREAEAGRAGGVVVRARAPAAAHRQPRDGQLDDADARLPPGLRASGRSGRAPGVAALAAGAGIAAAAAAGILIVRRRIAVGAAAAGIGRRAAGVGAARITFEEIVEQAAIIVDVARRARDALALGGVGRIGRGGDVIGVRARAAGQGAAAAAAEAESARADRAAAEGQPPRHVEGDHAPGAAVPGKRAHCAGERDLVVLRHPDHLVALAGIGVAERRISVAVGEPTAGRAGDGHRPARGCAGGADELIFPALADRRVAAAEAAIGAVAVAAAVAGIDRRVLHLDDEQEVAGRDRRRRPGRGSDRDRRRARSDGSRAGVISVDHARDARRAVAARRAAPVRRRRGGDEREEKREERGDDAPHRRPIPRP